MAIRQGGRFVRLLGVLALYGLALGAPAADRPNMVLVMMDDLDLSVWNSALQLGVLPNIQRHVIAQGTTFVESFVSQSYCCPSRATVLKGQYPHNHGVVGTSGPRSYDRFDESSTLATWLQAGGYRTGLIGKYMNGYQDGHVPPGWDVWKALVPRTPPQCMYGYTLTQSGRPEKTYGQAPEDFQTDVLTSEGVQFLRNRDSRPFFLLMTPTTPHTEYCEVPESESDDDDGDRLRTAPRYEGLTPLVTLPARDTPSFNEADMSDKPRWMRRDDPVDAATSETLYNQKIAAIRTVDDMVGRLAAALQATGEYDRTLFIVTSDNGYQYGTHRRRAKRDVYDESIRVPLVIRAPGQMEPRRSKEWVLNNDWAPTLLDYAGTTAGLVLDGRSLRPFLEGQPGSSRQSILLEQPDDKKPRVDRLPFAAIRTRHPDLTLDPTGATAMVYVESYDQGSGRLNATELYDLSTDPLQLESLHKSTHPRTVQQKSLLKARLDKLKNCDKGKCAQLEDGPPPQGNP